MNFRTELAKWGYNKGNSIDVEILVNEILPSLFSQQEKSYSEEKVKKVLLDITLVNPPHISLLHNGYGQYGYGQFPDTYEITEKGIDYIIEQFKKNKL